MRVGIGLAQIGEFSFIIASLGVTLNVTSKFLYPIGVAESAITTLLTPYLIKNTDALVNWFDRAAGGAGVSGCLYALGRAVRSPKARQPGSQTHAAMALADGAERGVDCGGIHRGGRCRRTSPWLVEGLGVE